MSESLDDDDPGLETQPPTNPLPLLPPPFAPAIVSATPADDVESDPDSPVLQRRTYTSSPPDSHTQPQRTSPAADFSDDDDDHLFTQPPTVARSPFVAPSWHELVQEMGRVDRLQNAEPGSNQYNIYLNLNTYLSLWMRVQLEPNSSVRHRQNNDILSVLRFLILPHECYHSVIESHFEDPTLSTPRDGCENNCSYCTGAYQNFCGRVSKRQLIYYYKQRFLLAVPSPAPLLFP